MWVLVVLVVFGLVLPYSDALYTSGHLKDIEAKKPIFLEKFCFSNEGNGAGEVLMKYDSRTRGSYVAFFDDVVWDKVKPILSNLTCAEILTDAGFGSTHFSGNYIWKLEGKSKIQFNILDVVRPHHWYSFIVNCQGLVDVEYSLLFLNRPDGWERQLSYDVVGLPIAYGLFAVVCIVLFVFHSVAHSKAIAENNEACKLPTVKMVQAALLGFAFGNICWLVHFVVFVEDGIGVEALAGLGQWLHVVAETIVLAILLLVAQGWTITQLRLHHKRQVLMALLLYASFHAVLLVWGHCCLERADTVYVYDTGLGISVLVVQMLLCIWFVWMVYQKVLEQYETNKTTFYIWFGIGGACWFLLVPTTVIIATLLPAYVREKAVVCMRLISEFLTISGLMFAVWPTRAAQVFQVHMAHSLIGVDDLETI